MLLLLLLLLLVVVVASPVTVPAMHSRLLQGMHRRGPPGIGAMQRQRLLLRRLRRRVCPQRR